jgi:signal transduction histidine kinase
MAAVDFNTKLFWANIQYFAYCYSPVTLLALCMHFTGYDKWVVNKKILWFAVVPTFIVILVWTDGWHGLMRYDMHMDYSGLFPVITKKYGPAFYIHAVYSHLLNITAWVLVTRTVFFKNTVYRNQATALFIGISMIVVPNILYITGLGPIKKFDITPMFFGPAGVIIAWGIFRYKLFEVIPVARATVIENMDAGVMVLDLQDRVLDINPAMRSIVDYSDTKKYAGTVEEVCCKIPGLVNACKDRNIAQSEFIMDKDGAPKVYEVFLSTLSSHKDAPIGRLVITYDITEKKLEQRKYLKQQRMLAVTEERERLARDLHDNLGQVLGFINLQAQGIRQELENVDVNIVSDKLDKLVNVSQAAHSDIRNYIRNVRNTEAMEKDFMTELAKTVMSFEEQSGQDVRLSIPVGFTGEELKPDIRINLLNIIRESLNNIEKHAEANHVSIRFSLTQGQLYAAIEDDGKGFDTNLKPGNFRTGFGLNIIRERASEMGAQIEIKSVVGKGSRIAVIVPIS